MIFDGHWKREVKVLSREISLWRRLLFPSDYAAHRLNRAILYSAAILRKIIEDEREAEKLFRKRGETIPHKLLLNAKLPAIRYPYTAEDGWPIRGSLFPEDYGEGERVELSVQEVCNQLIHSYVWSLAWESNKKSYAGFFVASDRSKETHVHAIHFSDWQEILKLCTEESAI